MTRASCPAALKKALSDSNQFMTFNFRKDQQRILPKGEILKNKEILRMKINKSNLKFLNFI